MVVIWQVVEQVKKLNDITSKSKLFDDGNKK